MFLKEFDKRSICEHSKCQLVRLIIRENVHIAHQVDSTLKYYKFRTLVIDHIKSILFVIACHIALKRLSFLIKHTSHACKSGNAILVIPLKYNVMVMPALINKSLRYKVVDNIFTDASFFLQIGIQETIIR